MAQPGRTSEATVETVDLYPTLTDLCGIIPPAGLDGQSLRAQLNDPAASTTKPALGFWTNGQRTVRNARWRLIAQPGKEGAPPRVELFDYETDPGETRNHAAEQPEVVRELLARLEAGPRP
jgi:iduronate 2-sulfatase